MSINWAEARTIAVGVLLAGVVLGLANMLISRS